MIQTENKNLRIPSNAESIGLVEKLIDSVSSTFKVKEDAYGNILVALTEAVNNAIYHGNKSNSDKNIDVSVKSSPSTISFTIKDEGAGFDYNNLPDPTDPLNIEKPNGRGVFLMRHLADNILFEDNGSKVTLDFNLS